MAVIVQIIIIITNKIIKISLKINKVIFNYIIIINNVNQNILKTPQIAHAKIKKVKTN